MSSPFDIKLPQGYLLIINAGDENVEYYFSLDFEQVQRELKRFVRGQIAPKNPALLVTQEMIDKYFKKTDQTYTIEEPVIL